jgi:hypothetical protein
MKNNIGYRLLYCSKSHHKYLTNLEHQVYHTFLPLNFLVDGIYVGPSSHYGCFHTVHIFTRDETGLVYLPTQLQRTLQLYW